MYKPIFNNVFRSFEYYPFGMVMFGRSYSATRGYRFGFNKGSEKDNELYGEGNAYSTFYRELDTRLGLWWGRDPEPKAFESPYISMGDNPILNNDVKGNTSNSTDVRQNKDGTYKVVGGKLDGDKNIYVLDNKGNRTGKTIGKSLFETSFYSADDKKWLGTIDTKSTAGCVWLKNNIFTNTPSTDQYILHWEKYNYKVFGYDKSKGVFDEYLYRGSQYSPNVFASARDFGNLAAGYVAGNSGFSWQASKFAFERFQASDNLHHPIKGLYRNGTEPAQTVQGEMLGWKLGYTHYQNVYELNQKRQNEIHRQMNPKYDSPY